MRRVGNAKYHLLPGRTRRGLLRSLAVASLVAGLLTPTLSNPARAITVPVTRAGTLVMRAAPSPQRVSFDVVPTHVAFSWHGPEDSGIRYRVVDDDVVGTWTIAWPDHYISYGKNRFSAVL